jgi:hypothetical protein
MKKPADVRISGLFQRVSSSCEYHFTQATNHHIGVSGLI